MVDRRQVTVGGGASVLFLVPVVVVVYLADISRHEKQELHHTLSSLLLSKLASSPGPHPRPKVWSGLDLPLPGDRVVTHHLVPGRWRLALES